MARILGRIWVRFGLTVSAAILIFVIVLGACLLMFSGMAFTEIYRSPAPGLCSDTHASCDEDHADRAVFVKVLGDYTFTEPTTGEKLALALAIFAGMFISMLSGFLASRVVTQPLQSMAIAATRVASGDLTVRAEVGRAHGEMAGMIRDFNHMIDALETLDKKQRVTLASVSHELRTPLAVLSARLYGICDGVIQADEQEMRGLLDQSLHLSRLVEDLRTLSLASMGRLSLQLTPLDLSAVVADALAGFAPRLAESGFVVHDRLSRELTDHPILADPDRLRQIVGNLVENALRHAASGRWIEVATYMAEGRAVLAVSDAGPGLPPAVKQQPFRRFPHAPGHSRKGSGLGLSIVRTLAQLQGAEVDADTSERHGARIRVCFPLVRPGAPSAQAPAPCTP